MRERAADERGMPVYQGVDTHSNTHVGVALEPMGRRMGVLAVPNSAAGYARLWDWMLEFGTRVAAGVEGTGSYGAGRSRFLRARRLRVVEVNRTSRQHDAVGTASTTPAMRRLRRGRSSRAKLPSGEPKGADGAAESLRALRAARRSAVKARTQAANQLHALVSSAPEQLKASLRGLPAKRLAEKASRLQCAADPVEPTAATKFALRSVARRHRDLSVEISQLEAQIERVAREAAPELVALDGVGPDTAATLLVAAGDN